MQRVNDTIKKHVPLLLAFLLCAAASCGFAPLSAREALMAELKNYYETLKNEDFGRLYDVYYAGAGRLKMSRKEFVAASVEKISKSGYKMLGHKAEIVEMTGKKALIRVELDTNAVEMTVYDVWSAGEEGRWMPVTLMRAKNVAQQVYFNFKQGGE